MDLPRLMLLSTTFLVTHLSQPHFACACPSCETVYFNSQQNVRFNSAMEGRTIPSERTHVSSVFECFIRCQKNCLCESFNFLRSQLSGGECELNEADAHKDPSAIKTKNGSLFYNLHRQVAPGCPDCSSALSCCATSQPCYNGQCIDSCNEMGRRYRCQCSPNYDGMRCENFNIND